MYLNSCSVLSVVYVYFKIHYIEIDYYKSLISPDFLLAMNRILKTKKLILVAWGTREKAPYELTHRVNLYIFFFILFYCQCLPDNDNSLSIASDRDNVIASNVLAYAFLSSRT